MVFHSISDFLQHLDEYKLECAKEPFHKNYICRLFRDKKNKEERVSLEGILEENDGAIVHGEAGIGKTFSAKHIRHKWCKEDILEGFHLLYFDSKKINQKLLIRSTAAPLYFSEMRSLLKAKGKTTDDLAIFNYVKTTISNLLVVIDGIDEFPIKELVKGNYLSELERKIEDNEKISAKDTIMGIYFGMFFPKCKICLFGRTGEFERLKRIKDQPNSSIFNKTNIRELELLPFDDQDIERFTCLNICASLSCSKSCKKVYNKINSIELSKVPTDLMSLIEVFNTNPIKIIGRITKTKLCIATLFNRLSKHTPLGNIFEHRTFKTLLENDSTFVNEIHKIAEMSFCSLLNEEVTIKVTEQKRNGVVYLTYQQLHIDLKILELLDFFYVRNLEHYYVLEPYHLITMEYLAACYLFCNTGKWGKLLKLYNTGRQIDIMIFIAGLFSADCFTRDFVYHILLDNSNHTITEFLNWIYNVENIRYRFSYFEYEWYGLMQSQRLSPALFLIDAINKEVDIPEQFLPQTIVCYCSAYEWYDMTNFRHEIWIKHRLESPFNIQSFLDMFKTHRFIIKGTINLNNDYQTVLLNKLYNHPNITFKVKDLYVKYPLTVSKINLPKLNSLHIWTCDSHTLDILLDAIQSSSIKTKIKQLDIRNITSFSSRQTERLFGILLACTDVLILRESFFTSRQIEILEILEEKSKKQINIKVSYVNYECKLKIFNLPFLNSRTISLSNNNYFIVLDLLYFQKHMILDKGFSNLEKYKIINQHCPFIYKQGVSTENHGIYLHLYEVNFTLVSPKVFCEIISNISTLECHDKSYCIPSSHWMELSNNKSISVNEIRVWKPTLENLKYFLGSKSKTLQFIYDKKRQLIDALDIIKNDVESGKIIKVFGVKYDENDYDTYDESVLFDETTLQEFRRNYDEYTLTLNDKKFDSYCEGEKEWKNWCCEICAGKD